MSNMAKNIKNSSKNNNPITSFDDAMIKAQNKVSEYLKICESNIVGILYKEPELFFVYNLTLENFRDNCWRVYFNIAYEIFVKEKKELDEITIGMYLEKHLKLKEKYEKYNGYETIENIKTYIKVENLDGYVKELFKWNLVLDLIKRQFPVHNRIKDFADMDSEQIYNEYEATLNHIFCNVDGDDKSYCLTHQIDNLIEKLDLGEAVGLPLYNAKLLTTEIGGNLQGNITLCGGLSGVGKSNVTRNIIIPSIINEKEKIVIMVNEEGIEKWQREMLVWIANNIYNQDLQKHTVRDGKYKPEVKGLLYKCAEWLKQHENTIIIKPFNSYNTSKVIKTIRKYSAMGVKYFILDTYKSDSTSTDSEKSWFNMQQNMVQIYDTIKSSNKNVHIFITFQLSKNSNKQRYYTQENIGMAKNIVDVASTCLMIRQVLEDEYENGKKELYVFKYYEGKSGKPTEIPTKLVKGKNYQIIFIVKNREGSTNSRQIVVEHDLSRNIYKEVGYTIVPIDW